MLRMAEGGEDCNAAYLRSANARELMKFPDGDDRSPLPRLTSIWILEKGFDWKVILGDLFAPLHGRALPTRIPAILVFRQGVYGQFARLGETVATIPPS